MKNAYIRESLEDASNEQLKILADEEKEVLMKIDKKNKKIVFII